MIDAQTRTDSFDDNDVPDTLPGYQRQFRTDGKQDFYFPIGSSHRPMGRLRRGFDDIFAPDPKHPRKKSDFPDYFSGQFPGWSTSRTPQFSSVPFDSQHQVNYLSEKIDLYPGQFERFRYNRYFTCSRDQACQILSRLYSDFDIIIGFERPRQSLPAAVVQSAGQVHPGMQGFRVPDASRRMTSLVELSFPASAKLRDWARSFFVAFRFLDRFVISEFNQLRHDQAPEFSVFPFEDELFLTTHIRVSFFHITVVCGFEWVGAEFVGHVFLWYSITQPESDRLFPGRFGRDFLG